MTITVTRNLGMLTLAIYLIAIGASALTSISLGLVTPLLALVAGILILIGK